MIHNNNSNCIVTDPELPPKSIELGRIANEISDIWKEVGLELGLEKYKLDTIELNNPHHNEKSSLDMLFKWKSVNTKSSRKILSQAIKLCRVRVAAEGMYLFYTTSYGLYVCMFMLVGLCKL